MKLKFYDRWGEIWTYDGGDYVIRESDKNIGGWFRGIGLFIKIVT